MEEGQEEFWIMERQTDRDEGDPKYCRSKVDQEVFKARETDSGW